MNFRRVNLGILFLIFSLVICGATKGGSFNTPSPSNRLQEDTEPLYQTPEPQETGLDPVIEWITFTGTALDENITDMAVDSFGNMYVLANRHEKEYSYNEDENEILFYKVDGTGNVLWQVIVPASPVNFASSVEVTKAGRIYILGSSLESWGDPIAPHSGVDRDAFLAEYDENGTLLWHTFLGGEGDNDPGALISDENGALYLGFDDTEIISNDSAAPITETPTATAEATESEIQDGYVLTLPVVVKLSAEGQVLWSQVFETEGYASIYDMAVAPDGSLIIAGYSDTGWGDPIRAFTEDTDWFDGFLAKLDSTGGLVWNTFMGGSGDDDAYRILLDADGNIYNCGYSDAAWGDPLNPHTATTGYDAYIAKSDPDGNLLWHTFVGAAGDDVDADFVYSDNGNLLLVGSSENSWGTPLNAYNGGEDGFMVEFDLNGTLLWNTFFGSAGDDRIAVVNPWGASNLLIAGESSGTFGSPSIPPSGGEDGFTANINLLGAPAPAPAREEPSNAYRDSGPYVPELTRYIPTPLDVSTEPRVIGTNILVAVLLMLPFALAVDMTTRLISENESTLIDRFAIVAMIQTVQEQLKKTVAGAFGQRKRLREYLGLFGVIVFYGLVFSLLDVTWNPFTVKGTLLFISMMAAYGVVGILDDIFQWRAIRKWNAEAEFSVRPTNLFLVFVSVGTSRLLSLLPGLMFGSPEALQVKDEQLTKHQTRTLAFISMATYLGICISAWLATILTAKAKLGDLNDGMFNAVNGFEAFLLVIFAVGLENVFVQLLGFSEGLGLRLKRSNRWVWGGSVVFVTFAFLHTLLNPRYDFIKALQQGNTSIFIEVAAGFILAAFMAQFILRLRARRKARSQP